jgi:hypothetical protein
MAVISTNRNENIKSLNIPDVLIDLLLKHSLNRERTLEMSSDELASVLGVDIDCAKLIQSSLRVLKN